MTAQDYDFRILFEKISEFDDAATQELEEYYSLEIKEFEEIRDLREIVISIKNKPLYYFSST